MTSNNARIILTRPAGENERLADQLRETPRGLQVMVKPLITVTPLGDDPALRKMVMNLDHYDDLIFISKSAARVGLQLLAQYWPQWPVNLKWYAVGPGTSGVLDAAGISATFPEQPGSEGLLELEGLAAPAGRNILIMRGRGGREHLASMLIDRGASVDYCEAYTRDPIAYSDWQIQPGDCVVLTSGEAVQAFAAQIENRDDLTVIVVSSRTADIAHREGFSQVMNAGGASDQSLYDAICEVLDEKSG